jgi:hypothetical protein
LGGRNTVTGVDADGSLWIKERHRGIFSE